jgi:predicted phosphate transport protein (TIGR00153 family)
MGASVESERPMPVLQDVVRWLLPKEDHFYDVLEQLARLGHEAAVELERFREEGSRVGDVRAKVQEIEHHGDRLVRDMEDALAKTFVTPIDREDLQKLASELDDVVDLTNLAARACELFGVQRPSEAMVKLMHTLRKSTDQLARSVPLLRKRKYAELMEAARAVREFEKEGDAVFRGAVSVLFHDPSIDAKNLLREKEILEDMENAIDRCDHVAETLTNIAVKNG